MMFGKITDFSKSLEESIRQIGKNKVLVKEIIEVFRY